MALIDTHQTVKEFIAVGMSEEHAEVITRVVARIDDRVASKRDISELKGNILELRTELKSDISELRAELKSDISELRTELKSDISELRTELKVTNDRLHQVERKVDKLQTSIMFVYGFQIVIIGLLLKPIIF